MEYKLKEELLKTIQLYQMAYISDSVYRHEQILQLYYNAQYAQYLLDMIEEGEEDGVQE